MIFKPIDPPWAWIRARARVSCFWLATAATFFACPLAFTQTTSEVPQAALAVADDPVLPDAPSAAPPASENFVGAVGTAARTIGEDEWHLIKAPFHKKALVWDGLFLAATGVLIANDESGALGEFHDRLPGTFEFRTQYPHEERIRGMLPLETFNRGFPKRC